MLISQNQIMRLQASKFDLKIHSLSTTTINLFFLFISDYKFKCERKNTVTLRANLMIRTKRQTTDNLSLAITSKAKAKKI